MHNMMVILTSDSRMGPPLNSPITTLAPASPPGVWASSFTVLKWPCAQERCDTHNSLGEDVVSQKLLELVFGLEMNKTYGNVLLVPCLFTRCLDVW